MTNHDHKELALTDERELWGTRAERLIEQAYGEITGNEDALPTLSAAVDALRIEAGELDPAEMDGYPFPGEDDGAVCTCPPDLRARGGHRGGCPVHGGGW